MRLVLIISLFISLSCGLRQDEESFVNPLVGDWNLVSVDCYDTNLNGNLIESYVRNGTDTSQLNFKGRTFTYSMVENTGNTPPTCNTSASGDYFISFVTASEGSIDYRSLVTSTGCTVSMNDGSVGNVEIPFGFLGTSEAIDNISWRVANGNILIEASTGFKGSALVGFCNSNCTCYHKYGN